MMSILKRLFRYRISVICFILGMSVSFLALYYGNRSVYEYNNSLNDAAKTHYEFEQKATFYGDRLPLSNVPVMDTGNCNLYGLYLTFNAPNITTGFWVSIYSNEEYLYPLEKGHYPTMEELNSDDSTIVIGRNYIPYIYVVNDKEYIDVQGERYCIAGVFGGESTEFDDKAMIFNDNMGDMARNVLESDCSLWGMNFMFQSNISDVYSNYMVMSDYLNPYGTLYEQMEEYVIYDEVSSEKDVYFYLILLYCVGITIMISVFWMYERKKELIIRRRYGYSSKDILCMLIKELVVMSVVSIVLSLAVILCLNVSAIGHMISVTMNIKLLAITTIMYEIFVVTVSLIFPTFIIFKKIPNIRMNRY